MPDIEKAKDALQSILSLPTANKETRYYAKLALSHLEGATTDTSTSQMFPDPDDKHAR